jgi:hypothetical protein
MLKWNGIEKGPEHAPRLGTRCNARLGWQSERTQFVVLSKRKKHIGRESMTYSTNKDYLWTMALRAITTNYTFKIGRCLSKRNATSSVECTIMCLNGPWVALASMTW